MNCYSLPSDTESDLLRHLVLAFGNWRWHIHGRPTARGARGVTGCGIQPSHFATNLLHHKLSPAGALCWRQTGLVPPVAASQQKLAFGAGAQGALAKVSVISRLESRSTAPAAEEAAGGKTRLKNVGQQELHRWRRRADARGRVAVSSVASPGGSSCFP